MFFTDTFFDFFRVRKKITGKKRWKVEAEEEAEVEAEQGRLQR